MNNATLDDRVGGGEDEMDERGREKGLTAVD